MSTVTRLAAAAAVALGLGLVGAEAMPVAPLGAGADTSAVMQVRDGCGPGFGRGRFGECRPFGGPGFYGPRRFYGGPGPYYGGGRRCFIRPTPYGPRRFCRW